MKNELSNWLKDVSDEKSIAELCIPGTHDTMTAPCDDIYYKTQHLSLAEQLDIGVRYFDLRITRDLVAAHREWISDITAHTIFDQLVTFLAENPSEFIIIRLQNANENKDDFELYKPIIQQFLTPYLEHFYKPEQGREQASVWPLVKEARGKIIALESSEPSLEVSVINGQRWAFDWHENNNIVLQDNWNGPEQEVKIKDIQDLLLPSENQDKKLILNHVSATNGNLANPIGYADAINPVIEKTLDEIKSNTGIGVLIYDFVHHDLSEKSIKANDLSND